MINYNLLLLEHCRKTYGCRKAVAVIDLRDIGLINMDVQLAVKMIPVAVNYPGKALDYDVN